jgi:DNA polymerase
MDQTDASSYLSHLDWELAWCKCTLCPELAKHRTYVIPGWGNPKSNIMLVGDKPDEEDDAAGYPFVGRVGNILRVLLYYYAGLSDHEYFLDYVVMCRTARVAGGVLKPREPKAEEVKNCQERLQGAIYTVDPTIIVALGPLALRALTGEAGGITKTRGSVFTAKIPGVLTESIMYPVLATYAPSYLAVNTSKREVANGLWDQMKADLRLATRLSDIMNEKYYGIPRPDREALVEQRKEEARAQDE